MLKKIVESFDIDDYEVLTDIGYIDIEKLLVTEQYQVYEVVFETCKIKCADKHIFIGEDDSEIYAQDAKGKKIKIKMMKIKIKTATIPMIIKMIKIKMMKKIPKKMMMKKISQSQRMTTNQTIAKAKMMTKITKK